jgi:hypothetical protein
MKPDWTIKLLLAVIALGISANAIRSVSAQSQNDVAMLHTLDQDLYALTSVVLHIAEGTCTNKKICNQ